MFDDFQKNLMAETEALTWPASIRNIILEVQLLVVMSKLKVCLNLFIENDSKLAEPRYSGVLSY